VEKAGAQPAADNLHMQAAVPGRKVGCALITVDVQPSGLYKNLHDLIRMAFPGHALREGPAMDQVGHMIITAAERDKQVFFCGLINVDDRKTGARQKYGLAAEGVNHRSQLTKLARTFTYQLLVQHLEYDFNPYGILTGVRPVKIVHRLLDQGEGEDDIRIKLEKEYLLSPAKARLLVAVAGANRDCLPTAAEASEQLSIYIGIPFCPSRCYYCSFPGAILNDYGRQLRPFVEALLVEMDTVGSFIRERGWQVQTVYLGGGTPTLLHDADLLSIFEVLHRYYISASTREITIEAGRPDTLNPARLRELHQAGVTRICINPQTMHDQTLHLIGRQHNAQMIVEAVEWARAAGIQLLNMDLIVGLPGENLECYRTSAEKVLALRPDNITVHTLAAKQGSPMLEKEGRTGIPDHAAGVAQGVADLQRIFQAQGFNPYYLYRQKYMRAGLENIGYTKPDHACLYNIQMIEERQTIIGMGGGASSKFVNPADGSLSSIHNPKDPYSYQKSLPGLIARKVDKLGALN